MCRGFFASTLSTMQLSLIRQLVKVRMGIPETDQALSTPDLNLLINASVRRIHSQYDWPWNEARATDTTVVGDNTIAEPADGIRKMRWVRIEGQELTFRNYRDTPEFFETVGRPVYYTEEGGVYYLLPSPDVAGLTVEYGYIPDGETELSADTDEPTIPEFATDMLIADVAVMVARRIRDRELESVFFAEYQRMLERIRGQVIETTEGVLPRKTGESSRGL